MSDYEESDGYVVATEHPLYPNGVPTWRFSGWDVAGIALTTVGGLFSVVGQGVNLLAREFNAMAAWKRQRAAQIETAAAHEAEQQRQAEILERQLGIDTYWVDGTPEDLK